MMLMMDELFACVDAKDTPDVLEHLLNKSQVDVNDCWKDDLSLLMVAAKRGHLHTVKMLIRLGASVNDSNQTGRTALMEAAHQGKKEVVKVLLANGADHTMFDYRAWTATLYALSRPDTFRVLKNAEEENDNNAVELIRKHADSLRASYRAAHNKKTGAASAVELALMSLVPNSTSTDASGPTWLHPFLTEAGLSTEEIALCEEKLIQKASIRTIQLFARVPLETMTHAYLEKIGIEALGVQQVLLDLHEECVVAAGKLNPTLQFRARDKMTAESLKVVLTNDQERTELMIVSVFGVFVAVFVVIISYLNYNQNQVYLNALVQNNC